ncbi:hypothetical protein PENSPDRAFT_731294 [Peniophora sp. CONT]|nr:hypothetical protein PENSPDRAFT_731294 [Peniophora sp. CONT]
MSIQFATPLLDNLDALPPLILLSFPRPSLRRKHVSDWALRDKDILPYLGLIPGFTGRAAANRAFLDVRKDLIKELARNGVARGQSFDATLALFEEREDLVAETCRIIKLDHPYMAYFMDDWALRTMIWSVVWHGRWIRRSRRLADARRQHEYAMNP